MRQLTKIILVLLISATMTTLLVLAVRAQALTPPPPQTPATLGDTEFTLPISDGADKEWLTFTGVGHTLRYLPVWQAQPYQAQGGIRDGAAFQFLWTDQQVIMAQIESLEIVNATDGVAVMETELNYWQQKEQHSYHVEAVTVQGHPGWWIRAAQPLEATGLVGTLWVNWGERVYRFRLICRPAACVAGEQQLRQMLSTLQVAAVDWKRAPAPALVPPDNDTPGEVAVAPSSSQVVTYNRNAAYAYASTYWSTKTNDDGEYITYAGLGLDGAHFVNRAVHAGGRPIPGLWNVAAVYVSDLRDWLVVTDGWTTIPAAQAMVGDVAIMGLFDKPCWSGLVVVTGTNPTLATHSREWWAPADSLYCYDNGNQTFDKTYLHANTEVVTSHVYLPVVVRDWPLMKDKTGIHLGNRSADWGSDMLNAIDGGKPGGVWPAAIVVLSDQIYNLGRPFTGTLDNPDCRIVNVDLFKPEVYAYMKRASQAGVKVIIRVNPSPGNFKDWDDPTRSNHRLSAADIPEGGGYCGYNKHEQKVRDVGDVAVEMKQIHDYNARHNWQEFAFEPANEPNTEWYSDTLQGISRRRVEAWLDMDAYFSALYDYTKGLDPSIRILTPPMAQSAYAEPFDINVPITYTACATRTVYDAGGNPAGSGYDNMVATYQTKNDGYSWHNYWNQGREAWGACPPTHHVFKVFPQWLRTQIREGGKPAFITEGDLSSPGQQMGNPLSNKDDNPSVVADSIRAFVSAEQRVQAVIVWLLNNNFADKPEYDWHEAYNDDATPRDWFNEWWPKPE